MMKFCSFLCAVILTSASVLSAADPFAGKWAYNEGRSPKPSIIYTIKDLGGNRFVLTGSTGRPITIKSDGVPIDSPYGGTVSFKKLDDRNAEMVRINPDKLERTYSVSADDKTLTLVDSYSSAKGPTRKDTTSYSRTSPGKGLIGEWQSTSMKSQVSGDLGGFEIEPFGKDGLRLKYPGGSQLDLKFDGKQYSEKGGLKPSTTSGKRIDAHAFQIESYEDGELQEKEEYKVSDDGKTLTIVSRPVKSATVFTSVFDRR